MKFKTPHCLGQRKLPTRFVRSEGQVVAGQVQRVHHRRSVWGKFDEHYQAHPPHARQQNTAAKTHVVAVDDAVVVCEETAVEVGVAVAVAVGDVVAVAVAVLVGVVVSVQDSYPSVHVRSSSDKKSLQMEVARLLQYPSPPRAQSSQRTTPTSR